ncbi:hypothetical protein J5N97_020451 [Dioscorea zingiberensis]|uniref:DUF4283 domain-containing protein n=1 Tax=Dioscorea zingiberensis TaxID=325984 RepID=A0A9D5CH22_9LILI|nr:hypothetical protein J5N97_020451 [Dioscorea zingiberensis]
MEQLYTLVALNKGILDGRERMKAFSIITVVESREGTVTIADITDILSHIVDENWNWIVKPLRDGRYIVAFPTTELARQTEKAGLLRVLAFDLKFKPWTPDLWQTGKAEGATRWVLVKNLPIDCWGRDEAASLLKPAGDLVAMDRRSQEYGNDLRLLLRIRWPRKMPTSIHCSMGVRQFNYTIELDAGQPALPWDDGGLASNSTTTVRGGAPSVTTSQPEVERRPDKGKAPMMHTEEDASRCTIRRRPTGIVIAERPPTESHHRTTSNTGSKVHHEDQVPMATTRPLKATEPDKDGATPEQAADSTGIAAMGSIVSSLQKHVGHHADSTASPSLEEETGLAEPLADQFMDAMWRSPTKQSLEMGSTEMSDKLTQSSPTHMGANQIQTQQGHTSMRQARGPNQRPHVARDLFAASGTQAQPSQVRSPPKPNKMTEIPLTTPGPIIPCSPNLHPEPHQTQNSGPNPDPIPIAVTNELPVINVMGLPPYQSKSPMRPFNYLMALYNPKEKNITPTINGLEIDLSKASLKNIGNTWNLITEDAWELIIKGPDIITTRDTRGNNTARDTRGTTVGSQKGKAKKAKSLNKLTTPEPQKVFNKASTTNKGQKKRKEKDTPLNLTTVLITLSQWPGERIVQEALKVGVLLDNFEGDIDQIAKHLRLSETEECNGGVDGN